MKKLTVILLMLILFSSCKKEDPPVLTGIWDIYQTFTSGSTSNWTVTITQDGKNLTGNAVFSYNSNYALLLSSSCINDNNVIIEWMLSSWKLSFQGAVNVSFTSMHGTFYGNGLNMGNWLANKKE